MRMEKDEVVRDEIEEERRRLRLIEGEEEVGWESPPAGEEEKREKRRGMDRKMEIREERMIEENEEGKEKKKERGKMKSERMKREEVGGDLVGGLRGTTLWVYTSRILYWRRLYSIFHWHSVYAEMEVFYISDA